MRRRHQAAILILLVVLILLVGVPLNDQFGSWGHEIAVALGATFLFLFVKWRLVGTKQDPGKK